MNIGTFRRQSMVATVGLLCLVGAAVAGGNFSVGHTPSENTEEAGFVTVTGHPPVVYRARQEEDTGMFGLAFDGVTVSGASSIPGLGLSVVACHKDLDITGRALKVNETGRVAMKKIRCR